MKNKHEQHCLTYDICGHLSRTGHEQPAGGSTNIVDHTAILLMVQYAEQQLQYLRDVPVK